MVEFKPAAGDEQQREAGAGLFVVDADVAFFVERHGSSSLARRVQPNSAIGSTPEGPATLWSRFTTAPRARGMEDQEPVVVGGAPTVRRREFVV